MFKGFPFLSTGVNEFRWLVTGYLSTVGRRQCVMEMCNGNTAPSLDQAYLVTASHSSWNSLFSNWKIQSQCDDLSLMDDRCTSDELSNQSDHLSKVYRQTNWKCDGMIECDKDYHTFSADVASRSCRRSLKLLAWCVLLFFISNLHLTTDQSILTPWCLFWGFNRDCSANQVDNRSAVLLRSTYNSFRWLNKCLNVLSNDALIYQCSH